MSKGSQEFLRPSRRVPIYAAPSYALVAATAASFVINRYQNAVEVQQPRAEQRLSRAAPSLGSWPLSDHFSWSSESEQSQLNRLIPTIPDPGPVHVVVACLAYSIAINVFYHTHKRDRYQLGIAACGTLSTLAVGWASKEDTQNVVTGLGPWAVIASLLLSAAFHRLLRDYGGEARISL